MEDGSSECAALKVMRALYRETRFARRLWDFEAWSSESRGEAALRAQRVSKSPAKPSDYTTRICAGSLQEPITPLRPTVRTRTQTTIPGVKPSRSARLP
jgi:hypothetical protein